MTQAAGTTPRDHRPTSSPTSASTLQIAAVLGGGVVLILSLYFEVDAINGAPYWRWPWRSLAPWPLVPLMLGAAIPFVAAQLFAEKAQWRRGLLSLTAALFLAQMAGVSGQPGASGLGRLGAVVASPFATSYYTDALKVRSWRGALGNYDRVLPHMSLHSRTKPPGQVLFYGGLLKIVAAPRAAVLGGVLIALLASLAVPAVFAMAKALEAREQEAFAAASLLTLCPGLVLFCPQFDQVYPILSAFMATSWLRALRTETTMSAWLFGVVLVGALFLSYAVLSVGTFLFGATLLWWISKTDRVGALIHITRQSARSFAVVGTVMLALYLTVGYDPVAVSRVIVEQQRAFLVLLQRPYLQALLHDPIDFLLTLGWLPLFLGVGLWTRRGEGFARKRWLALACWGQVAIVDLVGLLRGETARLWLFLVPFALVPAGMELAGWSRRARAGVYAMAWLIVVAQACKLVFIDVPAG